MEQSQTTDDGKRMRCLKTTMNKTLKAFTSHIRLVKLISNTSSAVLKNLNEEVKKQLENNIKSELETIYEEENITSLLNGLDQLVDSSLQSEQTRWRPSGDVEADTRVHVAALKMEQLHVLEKTLVDLEAQNKLLQDQEQKLERRLLRSRDKLVSLLTNTQQTVQQETSALEQFETILDPLDR